MRKYFFLLTLLFLSCNSDPKELCGYDIEIFKNTPVWDLAKAVEKNDTAKINKMASRFDLNYRSPFNKMTLLYWAVYNYKVDAAKTLLMHGADPNIKDFSGSTPICVAARMYDSSDMLKLLLRHGADPNIVAIDSLAPLYVTPLIGAAAANLENVQILLERHVDTNYISPNGSNAFGASIMFDKLQIAKFLLINCNVKVDFSEMYQNHILFYLRTMTFPLNSDDYKIKMEIVDYLRRKGIDYSKYPIPNYIQEKYDKEYLEKY